MSKCKTHKDILFTLWKMRFAQEALPDFLRFFSPKARIFMQEGLKVIQVSLEEFFTQYSSFESLVIQYIEVDDDVLARLAATATGPDDSGYDLLSFVEFDKEGKIYLINEARMLR